MVMKNVTKQIQKIPYLILLLLLSFLPTLAQNGVTVKGTVVDGNGETVIGASVVVKNNTCSFIYRNEIAGSQNYRSEDFEGHFRR